MPEPDGGGLADGPEDTAPADAVGIDSELAVGKSDSGRVVTVQSTAVIGTASVSGGMTGNGLPIHGKNLGRIAPPVKADGVNAPQPGQLCPSGFI